MLIESCRVERADLLLHGDPWLQRRIAGFVERTMRPRDAAVDDDAISEFESSTCRGTEHDVTRDTAIDERIEVDAVGWREGEPQRRRRSQRDRCREGCVHEVRVSGNRES